MHPRAVLLILVIKLSLAAAAVAQQPGAPDLVARGTTLLTLGLEGMKTFLRDASAPPLTFDQETQIRGLHDRYLRQEERLISENSAAAGTIRQTLGRELFLAAARFLNPVQREALGVVLDASANSDLPTDENELREYLRDLVSPGADGDDDLVIDGFSGGRMPNRDEILEIRINDNAFAAEQSDQGRGRTEIRTRGGTGDFNGDFTYDFEDEALDARHPFAESRPPYQRRDFSLNLSAPIVKDRMTLTFGFNNEFAEEGDTLRAFTPNGLITDAVVRPERERELSVRSTIQLRAGHALTFSHSYGSERADNNGVGGFDLPEQAYRQRGWSHNFQVQDTAVLTSRISNEARFRVSADLEETNPLNGGPQITVREAFTSGGSTDSGSARNTEFEFGNLMMFTGEQISVKTGLDGSYQKERTESRDNFNGTFTFASLEDFIAERPLQYTVNQGDPLLETSQFEGAAFIQTDFRLSSRLTMGFGVRYEAQTNLSDFNNIDPRFGLAYHIGGTTVLRAGTGVFHDRVGIFQLQNLLRFDGQRQRTLIIRNPSYPNPELAGEHQVRLPTSVHVRAEDLAAPYSWHSEAAVETTLPFGMAVTGSYRFVRGVHLLRGRNLNAPLDITSAVPRSCAVDLAESLCLRPQPDKGNVIQMESTGLSSSEQWRLGFQQRLSFLNVRGDYSFSRDFSDGGGGGFGVPADNYDMSLEWGPVGPRHQVDTSVGLRLPWTIDADLGFNWNSGEPYSLVTGRDDNRDTNTTDRPAGVPRNSLWGPSFFEVDLNLSKTFTLVPEERASAGPLAGGGYFGRRSGVRMTVSAEAENVLNTFNAESISGVMTSPFFGKATRARDGRSVSMAIRFDF
jgi:hypothetical protein